MGKKLEIGNQINNFGKGGASAAPFSGLGDDVFAALESANGTIPLSKIWADVRQPRRAIPASVRGQWDGSPEMVGDLLEDWQKRIERKTGQVIDAFEVIQGRVALEAENLPAWIGAYYELLELAASIRKDGLINPITVVREGAIYRIETGERRWLAHHLLWIFDEDSRWQEIMATKSDSKDAVWRQAVENMARSELNAISKARQLALLIMEARRTEGISYRPYEHLVTKGGCDRLFYAQVADGNVHRIPKGAAERIQQAMSLSKSQLAQYRKLLAMTGDSEIDNALWLRGDDENAAEGLLRFVSQIDKNALRLSLQKADWSFEELRDRFTTVNLSEEKEVNPQGFGAKAGSPWMKNSQSGTAPLTAQVPQVTPDNMGYHKQNNPPEVTHVSPAPSSSPAPISPIKSSPSPTEQSPIIQYMPPPIVSGGRREPELLLKDEYFKLVLAHTSELARILNDHKAEENLIYLNKVTVLEIENMGAEGLRQILHKIDTESETLLVNVLRAIQEMLHVIAKKGGLDGDGD